MRRQLLNRSVLFAWLMTASASALAGQQDTTVAVDPEKTAAIRRLLEVTEAAQTALIGMEVGLKDLEATGDLPPEWLVEFEKKLPEKIPEFIEMLVPVYAAQLSLHEIRQLIEFYETPVGRALIDAQGDIMRETMRIAEQWGMIVAAEIMLELAKRGVSPGVEVETTLVLLDEPDEPFSEAVVDERPVLLAHPPPVYPDTLKQAGIEGVVELEFVIDTAGHVEPASIKVISSAHPAFVPAAKTVFLESVYRPGRVRGIAVRVLVRQSLTFSLQQTEGRDQQRP